MTRTYALKRLLEHGPLTKSEMVAITGWPVGAVRSALYRLMCDQLVTTNKNHAKFYEVVL